MEIVVDKIVKAYSISNQIYETDKENVTILNVRYIKVIQVLYKLCFYEEQNANRDIELITCISQYKRVMCIRRVQSLKQLSIWEFLE